MQFTAAILFTSAACFSAAGGASQARHAAHRDDTSRTAPIEVFVVNTRDEPRKGEQVVFAAGKRNKIYKGRTDAEGILRLQLPAGDQYRITLNTFGDTSAFGILEVPALGPNQAYEQAFRVDIVYEPARTFRLDNVEFDAGKATLRPSAYRQLDELVEYLQWKPGQRAEIAGHTDNTGGSLKNLQLSQQRAEAVRDYLLKKGIQPGRVVARGYGATQPVAGNETAAGRQKNRRTELRLL